MKEERRRDRVWKMALMTVYTHGEVNIEDIDVSMTTEVDSREEAEQLIEEENYREEDDITETSSGDFEVVVEPDASTTTKRSVLNTMTKERYGFLEKDEEKTGNYVAGPVLRTIASSIPDPETSTTDRTNEILSDIKSDPEIDMQNAEYVLGQFNSSENVAK